MATLQTIHAELLALTARVLAIEQRQTRFMRAWIASHLTSSTSGKTAPTSNTSTAPTARPEPVIIQHGRRYFPRVMGWLAEKLLIYLAPTIVSLGLAAWALLRQYGQSVWNWITGLWTSVVG